MGEIAGVMEDFHYHSFKRKIPPLILIGNKGMIREVLIKTKGNNIPQVRSYIQETFADFTGKDNVQLSYLTDNFDKIYKSERKLATLISFFAGLAILIASMGLLGLTIFTLKKRTKEIAIRKVNGANIRHILAMISLEYIRLIIYALLVTVPVSYFLMDKWLQEFAYKTTISWWIYAFAGFIALAITLITISFKAIKAANKNPVESLRYE
jgi:putative ABC transport system permease protein